MPHSHSKTLLSLCVLATLLVAGGSSCTQLLNYGSEPLPRALPPAATLDQVMSVVNDNTARVRSLRSTQATIGLPGLISLRAELACEPGRRFRLLGDTAISGTEVDLGSNDDLFWVWIRRNPQPALFFCRHDQFAYSRARQVLPVEPEWVVEAFGLTRFEPQHLHQGPFPVRGGRLEIRTRKPSADGELTKLTLIDEVRGIVLEQHLYDPQGHRLATVLAGRHRRDPATGAILPRHIEIQTPANQTNLKIDVAEWLVNTLGPESAQLFAMPEYGGYPLVDLADPNLQFAAPPTAGVMPLPGSP